MSLRRALEGLPDDRETVSAARLVVAFFSAHPNESLDSSRVARATGVPVLRVERIMHALADAFVIDCGDSGEPECVFEPSTVLTLEIRRYLHSKTTVDSRLQAGTQRFRDQYGR